MIRARTGFGALLLALVACGNAPANAPHVASHDFARRIVDATRTEATSDAAHAASAWLDVMDAAVGAAADTNDEWAIAAELAAIDALTERSIPALDEASADVALVGRLNDGSFGAIPDAASIAGRVASAFDRASDPFSKGLLARALDTIATHRGDAAAAAKWRAATGCASAATILGPLAWTSVTGVTDDGDPLAKGDAKIEATYATPGAFSRASAPVVFSGRGCAIDPAAIAATGGTRDVVVDVKVDHPQTIGVGLRARSAAVLRAGGRVAIERPYSLGGEETLRLARVDVPRAGTLRLVARVGMEDEGETIEIGAWDEHGAALASRAPGVGDAGDVIVATSRAVGWPAVKSDPERAALAVAALAAGDRSTAEDATSSDAARAGASPELLLAYARAVEQADDLDPIHRAERARGAYERVLEAWPGAWEAIAAHAELAGVRRGQTEQRIWTLRDLDEVRARATTAGALSEPGTLDALEAAIAGHDRLFDRAKAAFDRASKPLAGTALLRDAERAVHERSGAEHAAFECGTGASDVDRGQLHCFNALREAGERAKATAELDRVRALYDAPGAYLAVTLRDAIAVGDTATAARAYGAMLPGERTLASSFAVDPGPHAKDALLALAPIARDAPASLSSLFRAAGDDPGAPFAGVAERVTAEDRMHPILPSAATAVLAHVERYDVARDGLVRFVLFDVRRVTTTTDVEENAQADPPDVSGHTTMHIVRRRIFKKDGRVVEPDRTPGASQSHADLSQLEKGDAIEAIYEGWTVPGERGDVTIDTPDLLPDRTAVHDATIELRVPACADAAGAPPCALRASSWSHPLLGKPVESREGDTRVLRWTMKDAGERRIEDGTPRMDRDVGVSFSTATWADTARALRETMAALDGSSPEVLAWAQGVAKGKTGQRAMVDAVVEAAGKSVKEANASLLSDLEIGRPQGARQMTARSILANHEGSRTLLVVQALRDLGVPADVAIAENEPFSAVADFPPHDGRFVHPLVIAHVKDGGATTDVWIDADVAGPPLPAGRVSPELRGRAVLTTDGKIAPIPAVQSSGERDEVDVRLAVDERGDAKGVLTLLLRGRAAQELAEALERIVGDERQRMLRGVALAWVPFADVDDVVLSSTEESWQIAIRATLTIPGFAQPVSDVRGKGRRWIIGGISPIHAMYPRSTVATLGATYASQGARKDALAISRAEQYHVRRRIELPQGASIARAPGALSVEGPILGAVRKVSVAANVLEDEFTLSIATGTVRADAYPAFAADAHKIDDGFLASTLVSPAP